jgi:hypothetical protein
VDAQRPTDALTWPTPYRGCLDDHALQPMV